MMKRKARTAKKTVIFRMFKRDYKALKEIAGRHHKTPSTMIK